jgi:hypothetical protein
VRPAAQPKPAATRADRRRRLQDIADADLRDRFAPAPAWLVVGGLAHLEHVGPVLVWSIEAQSAEIQPPSGGLLRSVPLSNLSPLRA